MLWRDASRSKLVVASVSLLLFAIAFSPPLHAARTDVDVLICNPATTAELTIDTPPSDSTSSHPIVPIEGSARYTSQVEIYVDDGYNKTIALAAGKTDFDTSVRLSPGTHTITLTAIDICGGAHDTKNLVITYQPPRPGPSPQPPSPSSPESDRKQPGTGHAASDAKSLDVSYEESPSTEDITPGRDVSTDLPDETDDHAPGERGVWPLSYVNPDPLSFLIRAIIACAGAVLLSIRRRHIVRIFKQPSTVKWPFAICAISWLTGALLVLFAIFGYIF